MAGRCAPCTLSACEPLSRRQANEEDNRATFGGTKAAMQIKADPSHIPPPPNENTHSLALGHRPCPVAAGLGEHEVSSANHRFRVLENRGLLEADLSPGLMLTSVLISLVVGVISGVCPAWRSSRLAPGQALHG